MYTNGVVGNPFQGPILLDRARPTLTRGSDGVWYSHMLLGTQRHSFPSWGISHEFQVVSLTAKDAWKVIHQDKTPDFPNRFLEVFSWFETTISHYSNKYYCLRF